MAHGRHVGLLGRTDSTVVVTVSDPGSRGLLERTMNALAPSVASIDLSTELSGPAGALDTMAGSMLLVGEIARSRGVDPGQPRVAAAGRRLYHLPWATLATPIGRDRPIRMKARAAGMTTASDSDGSAWRTRWASWLDAVQGRAVDGLVLDYDGTCVATSVRTRPPLLEVQRQVIRLLEGGVRLGIASGRGPSIISELRRWVPPEHWNAVAVGIYNGGMVQPLSVNAERGTVPDGELADAASLLKERLVGDGWVITARRLQLTLERPGGSVADIAACSAAILDPSFPQASRCCGVGTAWTSCPARPPNSP